ncbi:MULTISPECIES: protein kinase domain-containing protein [Microbacterium]|uniref:protein kinase domain-containing protein n=1 Tax=Microbacterium TaxID=33882 RepID=UPI001D1707B0|nr:PASTA domain-containing protein [Microbacterium testaceum]MCC4250264.1 PASTA domain-containing protein [Microbacterium testaceum]
MTPGPGLIAERFRLEGLLGSGGTASVFAATDTLLDRSVAVKLLHPHLSQSASIREAFLDEARRTAAVAHPGIVEVVDVGTFQDGAVTIAWIAQELLEGTTLAERVLTHGPVGAEAARRIGVTILGALETAHAAGLVHRDISPANVLVRFEETEPVRVTLLDFGLADDAGRTARGDDVLRSTASAAAGVVGNVQYASPEQLRGDPVGVGGDLYQVGGLLYFALTGRAPFEGGDRDAVVRAQLSAPPPVASVRARGVPPALDRVLVRAMLKNPADRFADAGEMRRALEAAAPAPAPPAQTRVLRPAPAAPPIAVAAPPAGPDDGEGGTRSRGDGAGWGAAAVVVVVLALVAVAVPLMATAGRPEPGPAPTATALPTTSADPGGTTSASPTPEASGVVVPGLGSLESMLAALEEAGLVVGSITRQDSPLPAGAVLAADPAPGTAVTPGTVVRLVVASGTNAVPPVDGWTSAEADIALRAAGFVPEQVVAVSDRTPGTVIGSAPAGGASAPVGSVVRVLVSSGRMTVPTPTPTATTTPAPSPVTETPTPTPGTP